MKPLKYLLSYIKTYIYILLLSKQVSTTRTPTQPGTTDPTTPVDNIPFNTRAHWIRQANAVLPSLTNTPCPFAAFSTVIVNHTDPSPLGTLICMGANTNAVSGNPTHHGEIAAINNCSAILTDPTGNYRLSPAEALAAFRQLTLYTNAESCPMCASAIRWAGMREYVYGTSIESLVRMGWGQIAIGSAEVFERSRGLSDNTGGEGEMYYLLGDVLGNETDTYFGWQFDGSGVCPVGCTRGEGGCMKVGVGNIGEDVRLHDEI